MLYIDAAFYVYSTQSTSPFSNLSRTEIASTGSNSRHSPLWSCSLERLGCPPALDQTPCRTAPTESPPLRHHQPAIKNTSTPLLLLKKKKNMHLIKHLEDCFDTHPTKLFDVIEFISGSDPRSVARHPTPNRATTAEEQEHKKKKKKKKKGLEREGACEGGYENQRRVWVLVWGWGSCGSFVFVHCTLILRGRNWETWSLVQREKKGMWYLKVSRWLGEFETILDLIARNTRIFGRQERRCGWRQLEYNPRTRK